MLTKHPTPTESPINCCTSVHIYTISPTEDSTVGNKAIWQQSAVATHTPAADSFPQ